MACQNNRTELAEILLKNNKINVNLQDNNYGWSPFFVACENNRYESVLLMLQDPRVDVNLANNWGWSPLMQACHVGRTKIVQLLLSSGRYIDIHKKSTKYDYSGGAANFKSGSTALDMAKQTNSTDVVKLLKQYQKNPKETQKTTRNKLNLKGKK